METRSSWMQERLVEGILLGEPRMLSIRSLLLSPVIVVSCRDKAP